MEWPISFWGYKEQESNLILPEHDDDDEHNNIEHFEWTPKYLHIVDSSTKNFVSRLQCKGKTFLYFHGNIQQFYIVDS